MATYVPDPTNVAEPLDTRAASTAAAEFRALKTYLTGVVAAGLPPVAGKNGWTLQADTTLPGAKWVDVKSLPVQAGNAGRALTTDGTNASWATFYSFLPSMAGQGNKLVRVNTAQTAFEYATFFSQFPAGSPGYLLRLTAGGTDLEWTNTPALGAATAALAGNTNDSNHIATTTWVRTALFSVSDSAGVDSLFPTAGDPISYRFQQIRNNLKYIKETQIPAAITTAQAGNAASATKLRVFDTRADNPDPGATGAGLFGDFRQNGVDGLSDGGIYHGVLTLQQYPDGTGGETKQLAFTDNANLWLRGSSGALTSWGPWKQILSSANFSAYAPTLTGGGASGTWSISVTGNAATATALQTARNIGGVSFNGSSDINLPGVNTAGNQNTSGNAATATSASTAGSAATWTTARNVTVGSQTLSLNGSADISFSLASMGAQPTITGNGLVSITLTTTPGTPGAGAAGSIVGVY